MRPAHTEQGNPVPYQPPAARGPHEYRITDPSEYQKRVMLEAEREAREHVDRLTPKRPDHLTH